MNAFKQFMLQASSIDFSQPKTEVAWTKLTNVFIDYGWITTRPGLRPIGPTQQDTGSSRSAGPITAIEESRAWDAEDTSLGVREILYPTSTVSNTGWTITGAATAHQAVDDTTPDDDTTYIQTLTDDATITLGFGNLANSPEFIDSVIVHFRATGIVNPLKQAVEVKWGNSTLAGTIIKTVPVPNTSYNNVNELPGAGYVDYYVAVPTAGDNTPWTPSGVDAFSVRLDFAKSSETIQGVEGYAHSTTGADDDFLPTGDSFIGNSIPGITSEVPLAWLVDRDSTTRGTATDRVSVTYATSATALDSVDSVKARFAVATLPNYWSSVTVYHRGTDLVRRTVASAQRVDKGFYPTDQWLTDNPTLTSGLGAGSKSYLIYPDGGWNFIDADMTTNPETGVAWTPAEIDAGPEFGIQVDSGAKDIFFGGSEMWVYGPISTAGVRITQVRLLVVERQQAGVEPQESLGRIMSTMDSFQRLYQQSPEEGVSFVDNHGATAALTGGLIVDTCDFLGHIFFENSVDDTYYFTGSDATMAQLTTGLPLGHTIWTFGQRLFKGDIIESGTRTEKRIRHSGLADPNDWSGSTSGTIDLTFGGRGRIRKGLALSAHAAAVYLDEGIYVLNWTGDSDAPFTNQLIDADTGVVAPRTVKQVRHSAGYGSHIFLGNSPTGLGVYIFDGSNVSYVSQEIEKELRRLYNPANVDFAFGAIDRVNNLYLLFIPEDDQYLPEQCWVYHLETGFWSRWEFPLGFTCAGEWTLVEYQGSLEGDPFGTNDVKAGQRSVILGTTAGVPYRLDYVAGSDWYAPAGPENYRYEYFSSHDDLGEPNAPRETPIEVTLETGALKIDETSPLNMTTVKRLWVTYENRGFCDLTLDVARDGGVDFGQTTNFTLGDTGFENAVSVEPTHILTALVDVATPSKGRYQTLRFTSNQDEETARQRMRLGSMIVEYEVGGET